MEHYHCPLCGQSHPTQQAAHECLMNHDEIEILRYIAYEIYCEKHFSRSKKASGTDPLGGLEDHRRGK